MTTSKKHFILVLLVGVLAIALLTLGFARASKPAFDESDVGRKVSIEWSEVNVRTGYSTSEEVITSLHKGNHVTLTGYSFNYLGGNSKATESWVEIQLEDGTTGWVVRHSINWWG